MTKALTTEQFIERSNIIHNFKYDYTNVVYTTCNDKINIICPVHGEFSQFGIKHLSGSGCSKCRYVDKSIRNKIPKIGQSFGDLFPELVNQWSQKNNKTPYNYKPYSNDSVFWICEECSHEWSTSICNRTKHKTSCPSCCGTLIPNDSNRLTNTHAEISNEWDYERNLDGPEEYSYGSHKKKWWICNKCKFKYEKAICERTVYKTGCKYCTKSKSENTILDILLDLKIKFQQQYSFNDCKHQNKLYFDFAVWINERLMLIEFNGEQHYKVVEYWGGMSGFKTRQDRDKKKIQYCKEQNIPLLIIKYDEIEEISNLILKFIGQSNEKLDSARNF